MNSMVRIKSLKTTKNSNFVQFFKFYSHYHWKKKYCLPLKIKFLVTVEPHLPLVDRNMYFAFKIDNLDLLFVFKQTWLASSTYCLRFFWFYCWRGMWHLQLLENNESRVISYLETHWLIAVTTMILRRLQKPITHRMGLISREVSTEDSPMVEPWQTWSVSFFFHFVFTYHILDFVEITNVFD